MIQYLPEMRRANKETPERAREAPERDGYFF